jgi:hypothetical protein
MNGLLLQYQSLIYEQLSEKNHATKAGSFVINDPEIDNPTHRIWKI